jgi:hypothetical protein
MFHIFALYESAERIMTACKFGDEGSTSRARTSYHIRYQNINRKAPSLKPINDEINHRRE